MLKTFYFHLRNLWPARSMYVRAARVRITRRVPRTVGKYDIPYWDRLPRKGDRINSCCSAGANPKVVESVSTLYSGTITYTDGSSDSLFHCGWEHV